MRNRFLIAVLVVGILGSYPFSTGCAQSPDEAVRQAEEALRTGDYETARRRYRTFFDASGRTRTDLAPSYFEAFLATGAYAEGLAETAVWLEQAPGDPHLLLARGRLLRAAGRYAEAEAAFTQALERQPDAWPAMLELADLLRATGRAGPAERLYLTIYRAYQSGRFRTAGTLRIGGRAAAALEQFRAANDAFRMAVQVDPRDAGTLYDWAELFRLKYNDADARRTYEDALAVNPRHADVYVGLARAGSGFGSREELARKALAVNPNHVGALGVLAALRILDGLYDEAQAFVDRALAVDAHAEEALAHQAAIHHLRGDTEAFAAVERRALEANPHAGGFYLTLVEDLVHRFRYPDAVTFAQKAVSVDPANWNAYAVLGTALLRLGRTGEARRYLEAAFERDPYNLFAGNTLTLLDAYEDFALLESPHFRLLLHNDERDVLGPAMLAEAEAAYEALAARYPYRPAGKILIEAYNDADDFAVRVAGVPHLGLLGVSFGDVVALNTPRAQPTGEYNWARTLWHELAHTFAIGTSRNHVPRWFTEGLSVYEEQRARPEWGREMELVFFSAFDRDLLLPLDQIDRGFSRPQFPGQILLSYYHAGQLIGFVVERHGFEAVTAILTALGQGQDGAAAFRQATGEDLASIDQAFRADVRERRARFAAALQGLPDLLADETAAPVRTADAGRTSSPFFRKLEEGREHLAAGRYDRAEEAFRTALSIYPNYTGDGNAYEGLAAVYRARGQQDRLRETWTAYLEIAEHGAAAARELAALHAEAGDAEQAIRYYRRALEVEPYDADTRMRLADLYESAGRYAAAVDERRALLTLDPVDRAGAYYRLARSLYHAHRLPEARRAVLQSLELAPGFREAQKLLLLCVDS